VQVFITNIAAILLPAFATCLSTWLFPRFWKSQGSPRPHKC